MLRFPVVSPCPPLGRLPFSLLHRSALPWGRSLLGRSLGRSLWAVQPPPVSVLGESLPDGCLSLPAFGASLFKLTRWFDRLTLQIPRLPAWIRIPDPAFRQVSVKAYCALIEPAETPGHLYILRALFRFIQKWPAENKGKVEWRALRNPLSPQEKQLLNTSCSWSIPPKNKELKTYPQRISFNCLY